MGNSFHNTLFLNNDVVKALETNAKTQEEVIYNIFQQHKRLTKADIKKIFEQFQDNVSESSISRALSNLDNEGKIYKTAEKRIGDYGVPNTVYALYEGDTLTKKEVQRRVKISDDDLFIINEVFNAFINLSEGNPKYKELHECAKYVKNNLPKAK